MVQVSWFSWTFCWGFFPLAFQCLLVVRGGCHIVLGYAPSVAWRPVSLTSFLSGACQLALVGLRCLWGSLVLRPSGSSRWVTCLRSGLCSPSVRDRNGDYPSFWWVWFWAFAMGYPVSGRGCVLPQSAIVTETIPPSGGFGSVPLRGVTFLWDMCVWGLPRFARNVGIAYASPGYSFGMRSPFGSRVSFRHS